MIDPGSLTSRRESPLATVRLVPRAPHAPCLVFQPFLAKLDQSLLQLSAIFVSFQVIFAAHTSGHLSRRTGTFHESIFRRVLGIHLAETYLKEII